MSPKEKSRNLTTKAYQIVAILFVLFLITAAIGIFLGRLIDERFGTKPFGTMGLMAVFYIISWIIVAIYLRKTKIIKE